MRTSLIFRGRLWRVIGPACLAAALVGMAIGSAAEPQPAVDKSTVEIPAPAYVTLLVARDPAVHAELALDTKQKESVIAAVAAVDQPLWLLRDVPVQKCSDQLDEQRSKLRSRLNAVLSAEQSRRFDQLVMQARGSKALVAPDVQKRLHLADGQREELETIVAAAKGGSLDSQKVVAVLSAEQRTELSSMFGKQFDIGQITYVGCAAPELRGVDAWINSPPLTLSQLQGKVVVVHFWAFNCSNCINNLPHYQAWSDKFPTSDLTIIGIHTPETPSERKVENLRGNVKTRDIKYPVAVDGAAENWKAWGNNMWPSVYLIDRRGNVRAWWYGELNWQGARGEEKMRKQIQELLLEK